MILPFMNLKGHGTTITAYGEDSYPKEAVSLVFSHCQTTVCMLEESRDLKTKQKKYIYFALCINWLELS